jgi:hypothetical protein
MFDSTITTIITIWNNWLQPQSTTNRRPLKPGLTIDGGSANGQDGPNTGNGINGGIALGFGSDAN